MIDQNYTDFVYRLFDLAKENKAKFVGINKGRGLEKMQEMPSLEKILKGDFSALVFESPEGEWFTFCLNFNTPVYSCIFDYKRTDISKKMYKKIRQEVRSGKI